MALLASTDVNLKRNKTVMYRNAAGKTQNAVIRAVTSTTLTLWLPSEHREITTVAKATTAEGSGWHLRH
jgi:hypothetical protein